jgi:hypothetical protein
MLLLPISRIYTEGSDATKSYLELWVNNTRMHTMHGEQANRVKKH